MFDWLKYDPKFFKSILKDGKLAPMCICGSKILQTSERQLLKGKLDQLKEEVRIYK